MITMLGNVAGPLSTLVSAPILALALGPNDRGLLAAATVPILLISTAMTFGVPESMTHHIGRDRLQARAMFESSRILLTIVGLLAAGAVFLTSELLSGGDALVADVIRLSSVAAAPLLVIWSYRGLAQAQSNWLRLAVEKIAVSVVRLIALLGLYFGDALTVASATVVILASPLMGFLVYIGAPRGTAKQEDLVSRPYKQLISFGSRVWIGSIAGILLSRVDQMLLLPLSNATQLGLYTVAVNIGEVPIFLTAALASVLLSSESANPSNERIERFSRYLTLWFVFVIVAISLTIRLWFPLIFGEQFHTAMLPALIVLISSAVAGPGTIAGSALTARGFPLVRSAAIVVALAINIAILVVAVPAFGALGAAFSMLAGMGMFSLICILALRKKASISAADLLVPRVDDIRSLVRPLLRRRDKDYSDQALP
jgi:O-antigen/teichoic acid export membrane protein